MNPIITFPISLPASPFPGGMILMYHRVTRLPTDPQLLCVSPAHFSEHLEVLRQIMHPMRLPDLIAAAQAEYIPENAVAMTFDDGYADNLLQAEPLLRQFNIPATFFVSTGYTGGKEEPFWDELDRIFLQPGKLPMELNLQSGGIHYHAFLGDAASYDAETFERHRAWNVLVEDAPTVRQKIYRELCALLHRATSAQRAAALEVLRMWAGMQNRTRASHRMMTEVELCRLAGNDDLMEIGAHTVTHPLLTMESLPDQSRELIRSKMHLEEILGRPVHGFSYPFGTRRDYTPDTIDAVRAAGFRYACSNYNGRVRAAGDPYQLPRFIVRDWDGQQFYEQLQAWREGATVQPVAGKTPRFRRAHRTPSKTHAAF